MCVARIQAVTYFASDIVSIAIEMKYHSMKFVPIMGAPNITKPLISVMALIILMGGLLCVDSSPYQNPQHCNCICPPLHRQIIERSTLSSGGLGCSTELSGP